MKTSFILNGRTVAWEVEPAETLLAVLRRKGLVSVRNGCDGEGSCGLCAVLLEGRLVNSCQLLALQVDGSRVYTVEHYGQDRGLSIVQRALIDAACVQCGYCTPAVVLALHELLERSARPTKAEVRDALSGTLCRCTGYEQFYAAARIAAARLLDPAYVEPAGPEFRPDLVHVGKDRDKVDAAGLARGERAFVEDRVDATACHLLVLPSPHAHAWVKSIDTAAAEAMPGVVSIVTHQNCPDQVYTTAGQGFPEPSPHDQRMFPRKLRYVGDRVAAVLAESLDEARAALAAIKVEYEVLQPVLSIAAAKASGAPIVHHGEVSYVVGNPPAGSSVKGDGRDDPIIYQFPLHADPHRNLAASVADGIGDVEKGFAEADVVIERSYKGNRVQCTPLEPHVVYAKVDGGRLVIHASTQVPWHVRRIVSRVIGISENKVRIIKERVGGGFGAKQDIVVEDLAGWLAWTTGRPVFFRYDRAQEFSASRTRHVMEISVKLGAKQDGRLTAVQMVLDADTGPYGQHCLTVPMNAISKSLPLVLCDNARFEVKSYYTNLSPAGAYQGYGAPKGSFALQTALAELAAELGMDQLDLLEKNRVRSGSTIEILRSLGEGRPGAAVTLGECGLGEMIRRGREAFKWSMPRPAAEPGWKSGQGAVIIQQGSGLPGLDAANAELRLLADGTLLLLSGGADLGTGLDTVTAKAAAEIMGLDMEDVAVISGDTDITPFDKGAYASSGTYFSGNAAVRAAEDLRAKCLAVAAGLLGEPVEDLRLVPRGIVRGKQGEISLAKLAHLSIQGEGHHELCGYGNFKTDHAAFPYGAHFAQVAVNERSGQVVLKRYHAYQDCGTPINPALALGQIYGGVMKAVGHSLYEEMLYDPNGKPLNTGFLDYKIPSVFEVPEDFHIELVPVADEVGPFGGKSVSEISLNGAAPAIAIAIHDAVGVWCREWPFTPERVLKALGKI
ncbi:MAG: molybdopterin-dependent oxidoreductase Mo/Fe-S-binding subunit [Spirochaetes bacterium GWD1_61_31]|nr:MAG: molybdopterin-dependent oxidoreductase Mo/Fe-S-binding subunit [Spirochaetes bacterium GWB1_60_80]OHD40559.1 MAG: molybdopterin-dependent oxidoreductase Mo/Fe-S-binding subunit [Spirochaetes bacterium GWD1_61_31]OHD44060.1 MAG: molybdopterin-dependent oxidoreductase Mo/Fe-S-binding subunit [Spirochaetes bacterium GWE1_60_18]HAP44541.1 molybdopterin-dependent oxidoreductase Mo/Fe-S-binding subunit [Spirochaetaceae bacterium]HBO40705.1 molybdopterin-dependent oxidoreductase Mo/Fe-S-bindin